MSGCSDEESARRSPWPAVAIFALAVVAHAHATFLPFALDDYGILANREQMTALGREPLSGQYFYRPTAWIAWDALIRTCGGIASAPAFHAWLVLVHGLTAVLLFRVLTPFGGRTGAGIAAGIFGLMPGGIQAVTWIAAAGDLLGVTFLLVAILAAGRGKGRRGALASFVLVSMASAASFLAKETMIALLPAAILAANARAPSSHGTPRRFLDATALAAGMALGVSLRLAKLGIVAPAYAYEVTLSAAEILRMDRPLLQMLVPWNRAPVFATFAPKAAEVLAAALGVPDPVAPLRAMVVLAGTTPVAIGILLRPRRIAAATIALAAFGLAFLPAVAAWPFDAPTTNTMSRTFYGPLCVLAAAAAVSIGPAFQRRWSSWVAWMAVAAFALLQADLLIHVARCEHEVGRRVRMRLESLAGPDAADPRDVAFLCADSETDVGGIPALGSGVEHALAPPFALSSRRVSWWWNVATLDRSPTWVDARGPVRALGVSGDRFESLGATSPAIPAKLPDLERADGGPTFAFPVPVATRAVAAVRVRLASRPDGVPRCRWILDDGVRDVTIAPIPAGDPVTRLVPLPPPEQRWRSNLGVVRGLSFEGVEVVGAPEALGVLPEIEITRFIPGGILALGELPEIAFRSPFAAPRFRVTFEFVIGAARLPMIYTVPAARVATGPGLDAVFVPRAGDAITWPGHDLRVSWHDVSATFRRELSSRGLRQIPVHVRIEAVTADEAAPEAASKWITLVLADR